MWLRFGRSSPFNTVIKRHQNEGLLIDLLIQVKLQFNSHELGLMCFILLSIWGNRNKILFGDSIFFFSTTYEWAKGYNEEFMKSCNSDVRAVLENFISPSHRASISHSQLKLRIDIAFKLGKQSAGLGVAIMDNNRLIVSTLARYIDGPISVFHAEAESLKAIEVIEVDTINVYKIDKLK